MAVFTDENRAAVARWFEEVWNRGNLDVLDNLVAPHVVSHGSQRVAIRGRPALSNAIATTRAAFADCHVEIEEPIDKGTWMDITWTFEGTLRGPFLGITATGRRVKVKGRTAMTFAAGLIDELWDWFDAPALERQLRATAANVEPEPAESPDPPAPATVGPETAAGGRSSDPPPNDGEGNRGGDGGGGDRSRNRERLALGVAALFVVVAVAIIAALLWSKSDDENNPQTPTATTVAAAPTATATPRQGVEAAQTAQAAVQVAQTSQSKLRDAQAALDAVRSTQIAQAAADADQLKRAAQTAQAVANAALTAQSTPIAMVVVQPTPSEDDESGSSDRDWSALGLFGIALCLVIAGGAALVWFRARSPRDTLPLSETPAPRLGSTLLSVAPAVIGLAAFVTVVIYIFPPEQVDHQDWWDKWSNVLAVSVGLGAAVGFAVFVTSIRRGYGGPQNVNTRLFGQLSERWTGIDSDVRSLCPDARFRSNDADPNSEHDQSIDTLAALACREADAHRDEIKRDLMTPVPKDVFTARARAKWVTGTGYLDTWRRLHRAEEALMVVAPKQQVIEMARVDELRLKDSNIENRDELLRRLRMAVIDLGGGRYLAAAPTTAATTNGSEPDETQARSVLREVRTAINEFRDEQREGVLRARNELVWAGMITGAVSYLVLCLAILSRADPNAIIAAVAFFFVGAIVGLFDLFGTSYDSGGSAEDFGMGRARLIYRPVLSGLAGVGGVLITALLFTTLNGDVVRYPSCLLYSAEAAEATPAQAQPTTPAGGNQTPGGNQSPGGNQTGNGTQSTGGNQTENGNSSCARRASNTDPPPVAMIFDLDINRFGFVVAAVFGIAPRLLIQRLQGEVKRYQADLASTKAQG